MNKVIEENRHRIISILKIHQVKKFEVFGSVTNDTFHNESDIDILVSFLPIPLEEFANNFFSLEENLYKILNHQIDMLIFEDIDNSFFLKAIQNQRVTIYENR